MTRTHTTKAVSLGLCLVISPLFTATAGADQGDWYINPMVGHQWFESDRYLEDDFLLGLGIEYHYSDRWAVELRYLDSSPDDADVGQLFLEYMYLLQSAGQIQPYLAAGVGHADFDYDVSGSNKETQAAVGAGLRYRFNERWSSKADIRWLHSIDESENDQLFTVSVSYAFGGKASPVPAAAPTPDSDPAVDSDSDGVLDSADQCPDTPAGAAVDERGCLKKLTRTETITLNVRFASNRAEVSQAFFNEIGKVADFMKRYPTVHGTIEGHTDDTGSAAHNKSLSQRRADAVRQTLIDHFGIDAKRLNAIGYGEERPVADNTTAAGRQQNRRVDAVFSAEVTE